MIQLDRQIIKYKQTDETNEKMIEEERETKFNAKTYKAYTKAKK